MTEPNAHNPAYPKQNAEYERLPDAAFEGFPHVDDCNCRVGWNDARCIKYRRRLANEAHIDCSRAPGGSDIS